jgi:hypothetical protein
MKTAKLLLLLPLFATGAFLTGCDNEDPDPVNEEELITTVTLTLTPQGGGDPVVFQFKDPDGIGGAAPVVSVDTLAPGTAYAGALTLLNESVNPAEDIGDEVEEEGEEHQFFFQVSAGLELTFTYNDQDAGGTPLGLKTNWTTGAAGTGTLKIILRHEPNKSAAGVADGDITQAGGETDVEVEWPVVIQ